jgi:hypothetical protein
MNITAILHYLDNERFELWVEDGELYAGMEEEKEFPSQIYEFIQANKQAIKLRLMNNVFAKEKGWLVVNFGEVYAYQYSQSGYIFIERNRDETVDIYRCKFDQHQKAADIKGVCTNISFSEAYRKAKAFLDWFYSENPHLKKGKY